MGGRSFSVGDTWHIRRYLSQLGEGNTNGVQWIAVKDAAIILNAEDVPHSKERSGQNIRSAMVETGFTGSCNNPQEMPVAQTTLVAV